MRARMLEWSKQGLIMQGSGCLSMSGLEVGVAMSQEWQWFDVATPIQIRYSWCHREIRCIALWTTSVGATWLNSTGSENMSRRCIIFGILRQRRGLIRTGTASPSCSQARPGARPWLCSWGEARISTPGRRNRTVLALFHWAKMMASKFREVLFSTWTVRIYLNVGSGCWAVSLDHFLRHEPNTAIPDFRRLHMETMNIKYCRAQMRKAYDINLW